MSRQWEKEVRTLTNVEEEDLDIHRGRPEGTRPTLGGEMKMAVNTQQTSMDFSSLQGSINGSPADASSHRPRGRSER